MSRPLPDKEAITVATALLEEWCWTFGIPEKILSDKGKEFRSKVWDALCTLLDRDRLNTTPFHPQCDGQSERNVQQIKNMIRAHVDEDQNNLDLGINQLCFFYNSSPHDTIKSSPFEVMFARDTTIPIDLLFPNRLEYTRPKINNSITVKTKEVKNVELTQNIANKTVDILNDLSPSDIESKLPELVKQYVKETRKRMLESFPNVNKNKIRKMSRAKRNYDRKVLKKEYEIGDWVLSNHPKLKGGLSRGLAPRYYGPFIIVGKYDNKVDYLIRRANYPLARLKQIHVNNLKTYFRRGHPLDNQIKIEPEEQIVEHRAYKKNPNNPRWKRRSSKHNSKIKISHESEYEENDELSEDDRKSPGQLTKKAVMSKLNKVQISKESTKIVPKSKPRASETNTKKTIDSKGATIT